MKTKQKTDVSALIDSSTFEDLKKPHANVDDESPTAKKESELLEVNQQHLLTKERSVLLGNAEMYLLTKETKSNFLSKSLKNGDSTQNMIGVLQDQLAAAHRIAMLFLADIYQAGGADVIKLKIATRLMNVCQTAAQTIQKLQAAGQQTIIVKHQNVQITGGQAVVANELHTSKEAVRDDDEK